MSSKLFRGMANLLFPPRCLFCEERISHGAVCEGCQSAYKGSIRRELKDNGQTLVCYSCSRYEGNFRKQILKLKFGGKKRKANQIASILVKNVGGILEAADVITYVPMSRKKRRERGYNQSELIANELSSLCNIPTIETLEKVRDNPPQRSMPAEKRQSNVKGAFDIIENPKGKIEGKNIILVDDIVTTGFTLLECAKVLYNAGAAEVTAICAAAGRD